MVSLVRKSARRAAQLFWLTLFFGAGTFVVRGDVLTGVNGERYVGTVIEETTNGVVFDSELAGRLTFPQSKIRELQHTSIAVTNAAIVSVATTNIFTNAIFWTPPG